MKTDTWIALIIVAIFFGFNVGRKTAPIPTPERVVLMATEQNSYMMLTALSTPSRPNPTLNMSREPEEPIEVRIGNTTKDVLTLNTPRGQVVLNPGQAKILTSENPALILIEEPEVHKEEKRPLLHTVHF